MILSATWETNVLVPGGKFPENSVGTVMVTSSRIIMAPATRCLYLATVEQSGTSSAECLSYVRYTMLCEMGKQECGVSRVEEYTAHSLLRTSCGSFKVLLERASATRLLKKDEEAVIPTVDSCFCYLKKTSVILHYYYLQILHTPKGVDSFLGTNR